MKRTIQLVLLAACLLVTENSLSVPVGNCLLDTPTDSVTIDLDEWKFIKAWAEYGSSCDSVNLILAFQVQRDAQRVETMETELNKERAKNKRSKNAVKILGALSFGLMLGIILVIFI